MVGEVIAWTQVRKRSIMKKEKGRVEGNHNVRRWNFFCVEGKLLCVNEGRQSKHRSPPSSLPSSLPPPQYFQCSKQLWLLHRQTPLPVPVTLPHYGFYGVLNHSHLHQLPRVRRAIRWLPLCCVFRRAPPSPRPSAPSVRSRLFLTPPSVEIGPGRPRWGKSRVFQLVCRRVNKYLTSASINKMEWWCLTSFVRCLVISQT